MSGLHKFVADQPNIVAPADNLLSRKSRTFAHPDEVVDDQELTLADKRSLLASWASDALAVEDAPSLRRLASGAVVGVDDVFAALKSLEALMNPIMKRQQLLSKRSLVGAASQLRDG